MDRSHDEPLPGDSFDEEYVHELGPGVACAALATGVPILPVRMAGATDLTSSLRRGHHIMLRWRPPVFRGTDDVEAILDRLRRALL